MCRAGGAPVPIPTGHRASRVWEYPMAAARARRAARPTASPSAAPPARTWACRSRKSPARPTARRGSSPGPSRHKRNVRRPTRRPVHAEWIVELEQHLPALAAVAHVQARQRRRPRVNTYAAAPRGLLQVQIARSSCDIAGIEERDCVDVPKERPARLGAREEHVAIMEAVVVIPAQRVLSAQAR